MAQWLRLHPPNAGGPGSAPGQETRSDKAQLKIPSGATKTQSSQINQSVKQTTLPCPPAPQGPRQGPPCPLHDHSVSCERLLLGAALQPWVHRPPSPARVLAGVSGARGSAPRPLTLPSVFPGDAGQDESARVLLREGPGADGQLSQVCPCGAHVPAHPQVGPTQVNLWGSFWPTSQGGQCGSTLRSCEGPQPLQVGTQEGPARPTCHPPVGVQSLGWGQTDTTLGGQPRRGRRDWEVLMERAEGRGSTTAGPTVRGRASRLGHRKRGSTTHPPSPPQRRPQQVHLRLPLLWRPQPGPAGAGEALRGQPPQ